MEKPEKVKIFRENLREASPERETHLKPPLKGEGDRRRRWRGFEVVSDFL
ncbi:MAG: hypothetical protein K6C40_10250 [Thermoguttaceae bacterium]|nr:hypothetical protein [Thermoguttaceae bacterium]